MTKKRNVAGKRGGGKYGLHAWNLNAHKAIEKAVDDGIVAMIEEGIALALEKYTLWANLDIEFKETYNGDPTSFTVELPFGSTEGEGPEWSFTINELILQMIELYQHGEGGYIGEDDRFRFLAVRAALQALVETLDAALARKAQ